VGGLSAVFPFDLTLAAADCCWRRFEQAIERALSSCRESGNPPEHHFAGVGKVIAVGDMRGIAGKSQ
jgi:hypothetical protein